jgi:DNA segregation ATPase FtsK/SpoIIIE-like protein
MQGTSND